MIEYTLNRELTRQEECDLLRFIDPYVASLTFHAKTARLAGFGIYEHKANDFFWAQVQALSDNEED